MAAHGGFALKYQTFGSQLLNLLCISAYYIGGIL